jgi:hypothetical protein
MQNVQISKGIKGADGRLEIVQTRTIDPSRCPSMRLDAEHYRDDGSCRCDEIEAAKRAEMAARDARLNVFDRIVERNVRNGYFRFASSYGERGYNQPKNGIYFADWNDAPTWLIPALERRGYAIEWEDEWIENDDTGKAYRSSPDSYSWTPYYIMTDDGDVIGGDEIEENIDGARDWYVNEYLLNNPARANLFSIDLTELGFTKVEREFASGWHPGQDDDPRKTFETLGSGVDCDIVFSIDGQGQFDTHWSAWTRTPED